MPFHPLKNQHRTPKAELICGFLGFCIVLSAIAYMIHAGISRNAPPLLSVEVMQVTKQEHAFLVEVKVHNTGGSTAKDGVLQASLFSPQAVEIALPIEQQELRFDYIPPSSTREGGILFKNNPDDYKLDLRFLSYTRP
jgi:uncharacterized protein (TIGR02588 family)